jgi:hypothetical protein
MAKKDHVRVKSKRNRTKASLANQKARHTKAGVNAMKGEGSVAERITNTPKTTGRSITKAVRHAMATTKGGAAMAAKRKARKTVANAKRKIKKAGGRK